jgi:hypothetical protein
MHQQHKTLISDQQIIQCHYIMLIHTKDRLIHNPTWSETVLLLYLELKWSSMGIMRFRTWSMLRSGIIFCGIIPPLIMLCFNIQVCTENWINCHNYYTAAKNGFYLTSNPGTWLGQHISVIDTLITTAVWWCSASFFKIIHYPSFTTVKPSDIKHFHATR